MKERKIVKLRVDMYEDTKLKIIDRMEKGDLINYVWTRIVVLAGKVNLEGDLYLSRNIPYSVETLAIEFNRQVSEIELSIKAFMKLEMVELTEDKVYRVKNFAKHQNIKKIIKISKKDNLEEVKNNKEYVKIMHSGVNKEDDKIIGNAPLHKGEKLVNVFSF